MIQVLLCANTPRKRPAM